MQGEPHHTTVRIWKLMEAVDSAPERTLISKGIADRHTEETLKTDELDLETSLIILTHACSKGPTDLHRRIG